jgi:SM-20-related protein
MSDFKNPVVIDDFLREELFQKIVHWLQHTSWKFGWHSNTMGEAPLYWNKHIAGGGKSSRDACDDELLLDESVEAIAEAWSTIRDKFLPGHSLVRCYANAHTFGLDGTIHRDNPKEVEMVTTLLYCHPIWPLAWGGETLFYDDDCINIEKAVFPKPARIVIFPGSMLHAAKSPARVCRELRISLVFKSMKYHENPVLGL